VVVDAILGTGAQGELRTWAAELTERAREYVGRGARVVAVDVPTGLNASTGVADGRTVAADLTITFGSCKRGHLARRDLSGEIRCLDIGLLDASPDAPVLIDAHVVRSAVPGFRVDEHKGGRKRVMIVGGAPGFAGASVLAGRGALHSGVGMIRFGVHPASVPPVQSACAEGVALDWDSAQGVAALSWPHALVIGPGLGLDQVMHRVSGWLNDWRGPVVVDADALSGFAGSASELARLLTRRPALVTPHATEAARLLEVSPECVADDRYAAAVELSIRLGCTVLLKGVPTLIADGDRVRYVVARGNPVLATGGSGDVLAGICGTLLAQMGDPALAAACAAWVHGRAAEIAVRGRAWRGTPLADVIDALREAWSLTSEPLSEHELARLPAVRDA
jgi:NAD(P)H-hydrate epimerase